MRNSVEDFYIKDEFRELSISLFLIMPIYAKNCHDFLFWEFIQDIKNWAGDFEFLFSRNWLYLLSFEMSSSGTMLNLIIMKFSKKKIRKKNEKNIEILNSLNFLRNYFDSDLKSLFWFYLFDFKF